MRTSLKLAATCLIAAGALTTQPAFAQESPTLAKIKSSGTIALGHRESSIPFSYYDDKQQVVGYSQELMLKVVDAVKAELKLPALALKLTPVTSQNRIPLIQNGTIDSSAAPPPTTPSAPVRSPSPTPSSSSAPA